MTRVQWEAHSVLEWTSHHDHGWGTVMRGLCGPPATITVGFREG
jgi:hypothetical protein